MECSVQTAKHGIKFYAFWSYFILDNLWVWRRPVKALVRRIDKMEGNPISRDRRRPRKSIR